MSSGFAQESPSAAPKLPVDEKTGLITYSKVNELKGKTAKELYNLALAWAESYFKNPYDVIRERDSLNGKLLCKARFKIMNPQDKKGISTDAGNVMYSLKLQFKEGRYRYELTEINWKQASYYPCERWLDRSAPSFAPAFDYYLQQTDQTANAILKSLEKAMSAPSAGGDSDW